MHLVENSFLKNSEISNDAAVIMNPSAESIVNHENDTHGEKL